jgi:hypothetical protein
VVLGGTSSGCSCLIPPPFRNCAQTVLVGIRVEAQCSGEGSQRGKFFRGRLAILQIIMLMLRTQVGVGGIGVEFDEELGEGGFEEER